MTSDDTYTGKENGKNIISTQAICMWELYDRKGNKKSKCLTTFTLQLKVSQFTFVFPLTDVLRFSEGQTAKGAWSYI